MKPSVFRFKDPVLTNILYELNDQFNSEAPEPEEISTATSVSVGKLESENNTAVVSLKIDLPAEKKNDFPFFLSATMSAQFNWDDGLDKDVVQSLLTKNAPALLLGYLRPWIAQVTEAGPTHHAIHIPFMDFTQEVTKQDEKNSLSTGE